MARKDARKLLASRIFIEIRMSIEELPSGGRGVFIKISSKSTF